LVEFEIFQCQFVFATSFNGRRCIFKRIYEKRVEIEIIVQIHCMSYFMIADVDFSTFMLKKSKIEEINVCSHQSGSRVLRWTDGPMVAYFV
jgi:hypothetical protein